MCSPDPTPKSKQCLENVSFGGWISERFVPLIQPKKVNNAWKILVLGLDLGKMCSPDPTPKSKQCLENISFGGWISERFVPLIQPPKVNNAWKILVLGLDLGKMCSPDPTPKSKHCLENISFGGWILERCAPLIQPPNINKAWKILDFGVGTMQLLLCIIRKMCSPDPTPKNK